MSRLLTEIGYALVFLAMAASFSGSAVLFTLAQVVTTSRPVRALRRALS